MHPCSDQIPKSRWRAQASTVEPDQLGPQMPQEPELEDFPQLRKGLSVLQTPFPLLIFPQGSSLVHHVPAHDGPLGLENYLWARSRMARHTFWNQELSFLIQPFLQQHSETFMADVGMSNTFGYPVTSTATNSFSKANGTIKSYIGFPHPSWCRRSRLLIKRQSNLRQIT